MKNFLLLFMIGFLGASCNSQNDHKNGRETRERNEKNVKEPKETWKVNKEFDENGNLISYDSIYAWSSDDRYNNLSLSERDSLMQSFRSRFFTKFSGFENQGFEDVFSKDSLFSKHFFNDDFFGSDFGSDFMVSDKIRQQMLARQKSFLEKYQSEFIKPEDEN